LPARKPLSKLKTTTMKTAVIAGGNSGIGKATAIALAKKGYKVIIHGRDAEKTQQAADEIKTQSDNTNVEYISADISTLKGMKELANAIKQKTNSIEAFVLSTGVILPNHILTPDGLEAGFVIQYLSRFALIQLLMPELKNGHAKIVQVGAPLLKGATIFFDDIAMKSNFTMMKAMAQEMFANHLFVQEFAKRNTGNDVVMNLAHVGIAKTGIMRHSNFFLRALVNIFGKSPEASAKNFTWLASDDAANFSGYFLTKPGNPSVKEKISHDPAIAEKLWGKSMELIKPILS
jgi:NAD(P)-dependent dehydrogenase (short-subunit alcohol dehydrogenase family)